VIDTAQNVKVKATRKFANTLKGFQEMEQWVKKHADPAVPIVYTMEATGIYYEQLAWHLFSQQQAVAVVLPNKARQYAGPADQIEHLRSKASASKARMTRPTPLALPGWEPSRICPCGNP
jgi:transposase